MAFEHAGEQRLAVLAVGQSQVVCARVLLYHEAVLPRLSAGLVARMIAVGITALHLVGLGSGHGRGRGSGLSGRGRRRRCEWSEWSKWCRDRLGLLLHLRRCNYRGLPVRHAGHKVGDGRTGVRVELGVGWGCRLHPVRIPAYWNAQPCNPQVADALACTHIVWRVQEPLRESARWRGMGTATPQRCSVSQRGPSVCGAGNRVATRLPTTARPNVGVAIRCGVQRLCGSSAAAPRPRQMLVSIYLQYTCYPQ